MPSKADVDFSGAPPIGGNRTFRQGLKASLRRQELVDLLQPSGKCGNCKLARPLEVHHLDGRDWDVRAVNRWTRVKRYWEEHERGVRLDGWCKKCNLKAQRETERARRK